MRRLIFLLALVLSGCTVGPDYQRPDAPISVAYKELQGWTIAQPQDVADRGAWWAIYNEPELDRLRRPIDGSNHTLQPVGGPNRLPVALGPGMPPNPFPPSGTP